MHPNLSPHLHTADCNEKVYALLQCRKKHPFKQYLGACGRADIEMEACFRKELEQRRRANHAISAERKKKLANVTSQKHWDWNAEETK